MAMLGHTTIIWILETKVGERRQATENHDGFWLVTVPTPTFWQPKFVPASLRNPTLYMRTRVVSPGCRHIGKMCGEGEKHRTGDVAARGH
jgi:hypothetical protein